MLEFLSYLCVMYVAGIVPVLCSLGVYYVIVDQSPVRALLVAVFWLPLAIFLIGYLIAQGPVATKKLVFGADPDGD